VETFDRAPDGRLVVTLYEGHRVLLGMLLTEVRTLVAAPAPDNQASNRLFPAAYLDPTEEVAEAEWQALVHDDLVRNRVAAFDDVRALLERAKPGPKGALLIELDGEQEEHLLGALNDMRLVLAELIDNTDSNNGEDVASAERDPDTGEGAHLDTSLLLDWLTELVSELVEVKLSDYPK
jgi:hypothetical protein